MPLIDDFKARFREFADEDVDQLIPVLEGVWPSYYGGEYAAATKEVILNLVAHLLTLELSTGAEPLRDVTSQSVGSISLSFAQGRQSTGHLHDLLSSTKYGKRFLTLTQHDSGGMFV